MPGVWEEMEDRREYLRRMAENTSRSAYAFARWETTGWGETQFEEWHDFGLTFVERPYVNYGYSVTDSADDQDDLVPTRFPRAWGGVYAWRRNKQGFYTGAHCFVIVETQTYYVPTAEPEPEYTIEHSFTFYGIATKDIPAFEAED